MPLFANSPQKVIFSQITPANHGLAGVFTAFSVDKPVDNVDNSYAEMPGFLTYFSVYVNYFSMTNNYKFLFSG